MVVLLGGSIFPGFLRKKEEEEEKKKKAPREERKGGRVQAPSSVIVEQAYILF